nr:MAG: hypothetical protein DIU80_23985 [Chloroflexota bacterium]
MLLNDLANDPVYRIIIVFDDLLGIRVDEAEIPATDRTYRIELLNKVARKLRAVTRGPAVQWKINPEAANACEFAFCERNYGIEIVTFQPEQDADDIEKLLDDSDIVYQDFYATTSEDLARRSSTRADLKAIYHPYPEHTFRYGPRGYLVSADECDLIGLLH